MNTPTEPGWYWHRNTEHGPWWLVQLIWGHHGGAMHMSVYEGDRHSYDLPVCSNGVEVDAGEWGPRIPEPERLKAMREMVESEPVLDVTRDTREMHFLCAYCSKCIVNVGQGHDPDCPWKRAQEDKP